VHAAAEAGVKVGLLCRLVGMTRQNYYKQRQARQQQVIGEKLVLELVLQERCRQPRLGARKVLHLIEPELERAGARIGRDRFLELLRRHELLIERRVQAARTTNSRHLYELYPNLAKDAVVSASHQLLLSDITYLRTLEGFMYLCLVSDAFSRSIVGYDCSDSLEMEGALRALAMALAQLPEASQAIHHSDRGCQYCCGPYIGALRQRGLRISMTEENHCYENAQAERLNGILKQEYGLGQRFKSKADARAAVKEAAMLYNHYRPHTALSYRMPMAVHLGQAA
jgi:putative transposase